MASPMRHERAAPLSRRFFARPAEVVARALLGKRLVCGDRAGFIVETEAYLGSEDKASHARFGDKGRSRIMFGPAGIAYVYLIYGMYDMFNVVTGKDGAAEAVLVRALELESSTEDPRAASGPGKLSRALGITRGAHNGLDLGQGQLGPGALHIARGRPIDLRRIARGPRVGVGYAQEWALEPLRFWIDGHPAVSTR